MKNSITNLSVILLLQPAKMLTRRVEYPLMRMGEHNLSSISKSPDHINVSGLSICFIKNCTKLACNTSDEFSKVADIICDAVSSAREDELAAPRIVVCGSKNVGKSTLLRYLMNKTLNISNCYHLEADLGQPEFTPPGCVSLTSVDTSLFGPPFTHLKNPEKMYFLGAPSVIVPDDYLSAFTYAFEHYSQHHDKVPLFVNTMGWVKDLGMMLLMDIFHIIRPTHVIQIDFEDIGQGQNFQSLTPHLVLETNGWRFNKSAKELLKYKLMEVTSISHSGHSIGSFTAAENRNLAILGYLGQLQRANCLEFSSLNAFYPYVVSWSAVSVYVYHHFTPQKQILFILNASWVALCKVYDAKVLNGDDNMPKIVTSIRNHECFGFGVVRGIDATNKLFYIISPEPLAKLGQVNCLVKGSINLPDSELTTQNVEFVPYLMENACKLEL